MPPNVPPFTGPTYLDNKHVTERVQVSECDMAVPKWSSNPSCRLMATTVKGPVYVPLGMAGWGGVEWGEICCTQMH